jgi:hypothetical protein
MRTCKSETVTFITVAVAIAVTIAAVIVKGCIVCFDSYFQHNVTSTG